MRISLPRLSTVVSLSLSFFLLASPIVVSSQKSKGRVQVSRPGFARPVVQDKYSVISPQAGDKNEGDEIQQLSERFELPLNLKSRRGRGSKQIDSLPRPNALAAIDAGEETEPNDTAVTASQLGGSNTRIRGNIFPNADIDFYSFAAVAGDRVYAAVMTSFSASASVDSILDVIAPDGTTVLETDADDGSFGTTSSGIAGTNILTTGTHYIRVRHAVATSQLRPYELYVQVQRGAPIAETEVNDTFPGQALPASGWVSGSTSATTDVDFYSLNLNAGDTVFLSLDLDPERDTVEWNGQLGFGAFGTPASILVVNDAGAATPDSESFFMTVKAAGTYGIFVGLPAGGTTFGTYNLSVSVLPRTNAGINCTTYTSTNVPQTIPTGPGSVTSTLTIPGSPSIENMRVNINLTHNFMADLDVDLTSPTGNTIGLFSDVGSVTAGAQTTMDATIDDNAGIPIGQFTIVQGMAFKPELNYRLDWFRGQPAAGTWTLTIRDDATADGGTLNAWSIEICEPPPVPSCSGTPTTVFSTDFESGAAGFTHSGAGDEWELGVPTFAPVTLCNSGTNCWKTDLDNTYNASSSQDLLSPNINLAAVNGPITLTWAQKFQIESANFDHAFVEVREVGNPTNALHVWEWLGATMTNSVGSTPTVTVQEAGGWGVYRADISRFAGLNVELRFHLDGDTTVQLAGLAIDDVTVTGCTGGTPATAGQILISEFRVRGPNGSNDEFIEIYNNTGAPHTVAGSGSGYAVVASDGVARCVIPNGTIIPAGGHFLCANSAGYGLAAYPAGSGATATGDVTYTTDIPDDTGIAIFNSSLAANFILANRLDAVGSASEANTLYKEGTGYTVVGSSNIDYSLFRKFDFTTGLPTDTNNNASDFFFVNTAGGLRLGAPGPENLSSPVHRNATIKLSFIDPLCTGSGLSATDACARFRDFNSDPGNNSTFGTLSIRRKVTNNTGGAVTRLRFLVVDITTLPPPVGIADVRARTSAAYTGNLTGGGTTPIQGLTLELPPSQPIGGGFNSTLSADTITLTTPLAAGASINIHFLLGVQQTGTFRFFVNVEALP